jgi:hypothetical protein
MDYFECESPAHVAAVCNEFEVQLQSLKDQKAIDDCSSMFNSIKGAAATYGSKLGRKTGGTVWAARNETKQAVGLMRLKDEGSHLHLLNVVGVPKAGGGAALIELAKAISLSLGKELRLEAADKELIAYYQKCCFDMVSGSSSTMVWKRDK